MGMQAWKLAIATNDGKPPGWRDSLLRIACAAVPWLPAVAVTGVAIATKAGSPLTTLGAWLFALVPLNYILAYWTKDHRALHERWLNTKIVRAT